MGLTNRTRHFSGLSTGQRPPIPDDTMPFRPSIECRIGCQDPRAGEGRSPLMLPPNSGERPYGQVQPHHHNTTTTTFAAIRNPPRQTTYQPTISLPKPAIASRERGVSGRCGLRGLAENSRVHQPGGRNRFGLHNGCPNPALRHPQQALLAFREVDDIGLGDADTETMGFGFGCGGADGIMIGRVTAGWPLCCVR